MAEFRLDGGLDGFVVNVAALTGGRFAALIVNEARDVQVVLFERAADGSIRQVGSAIDIPEGRANASPTVTARADGGFMVAVQFTDTSNAAGIRTDLNYFTADGTPDGTDSFAGAFNINDLLNTTRDPLRPELWAGIFTGTTFDVALLDPDTLQPSSTVIPATNANLLFDGGFGYSLGSVRGEVKSAIDLNSGGPVPTYVDPGSGAPPGTFGGGFARITAGNNIIESVQTRRFENPNFTSIQFDTVNFLIYRPDSTQLITFATEEFRQTSLRSRMVEVPGIGFAVLLMGEDLTRAQGDTIFKMAFARVSVFDFSGNLLGSQELPDIVGKPAVAIREFEVLKDPANGELRFLVGYQQVDQPGLSAGPTMGQVVVIDPVQGAIGQGQFVSGTAYGDYLAGLDTFETINAGDGNDVIDGHAGDDFLNGEGGDDVVRGGSGADTIRGGAGDDFLEGGRGNDTILGGDDNDFIFGEGGNDILSGGLGDDFLQGGAGNDTMQGDEGNDLLDGGAGNDLISGGDGDDNIDGGAGDDLLTGGLGSDTISGGDGNDRIFAFADFSGAETAGNHLNGGDGDDFIRGGDGNDVITGGRGNDILFGFLGDGGGGQNTISGGGGDDLIRGGDGADVLEGGNGKDTLIGGFGNDTMSGGKGQDVLKGGGGADVFLFASIVEAGLGRRRDVITDFNPEEDVIDVSLIFAGNVTFVGSDAFSGNAPEIRYDPGGIVQGDVNGDGVVDFEIMLTGAPALAVESFIL